MVSRKPVARRTVAAAAWWCGLFPLWFLFTGQVDSLTLTWAAIAAVPAAAAAVLVTEQGLEPGRPRLPWALDLLSAAWQTVLDFGIVTGLLARAIITGRRGTMGRFVRRDTDVRRGGERPATAWLSLVATYSPNAYVIDINPRTGRALLHDLRRRRRSEEPV